MGKYRFEIWPVHELLPGRLRPPSRLVLEIGHLDSSEEVLAQLRARQPRAVPLVGRFRLLLEAALDHEAHCLALVHLPRMDTDVDHRVGHAAQVELEMDEHQGRITGSIPDVHHHLGHVHRPALGEDARLEDGAHLRGAAIRVRQLQVMARHRLMNREQSKLPVVVLAQV